MSKKSSEASGAAIAQRAASDSEQNESLGVVEVELLRRINPHLGEFSAPVDKGIMERSSNVRMLPIDYRWNDVGSWSALAGVLAPDAAGNWPALSEGARLIVEDAEGCVAYAEGPELIALLGVRDLVVVRSGNATLVAPRDRAEEVKRLVERLRAEGPEFV